MSSIISKSFLRLRFTAFTAPEALSNLQLTPQTRQKLPRLTYQEVNVPGEINAILIE